MYRGFSLVELVIVMAVIALLLSIAIPNFRSMQQEGQLTQVEGDLNTLKSAVTSYWKNHEFAFPSNIHSDLVGAVPSVITKVARDPFNTDSTNSTYGYGTGSDGTFGAYFFIYTKGPNGDTEPEWDSTNKKVTYSGSGRVVSSAPVVSPLSAANWRSE
jgi:prepilin-type N-terminal cleavage/methylation domain-containing protein